MRERGTTLLEVVIVLAIAVLLAAAGLALAKGSRPFAMRSAVSQFDGTLAYARALAADSGNGATLVFRPGSAGSGFMLIVYAGRPTSLSAMHQAPLAPVLATGDVSEAKLGRVPFTIFLDSAGHAGAMNGAVSPGTAIASDPGCPSGESAVVLTFSDARSSGVRTIACNTAVSGVPVSIPPVAP